jgi:hypothetical protein
MPIREDSNPNYDISRLDLNFFPEGQDLNIITDPLELFLQEIFLSIQCGVDAIWGIRESINLTRYIYNKYVTLTQIQTEITRYIQLHSFHAGSFSWSCVAENLVDEETKEEVIYITFKILVPQENGNAKELIERFLLGTK